ncbi:hypothetical protein HY992_01720 [Candidatus Micrarchaeota archaeon]|nr:hypothetical protein [Candidatus Micrarchaeota archaeon]
MLEQLRIVDKLDAVNSEDALRCLTVALLNAHSVVRFRALRALNRNVDAQSREVLDARGHILKTSDDAGVIESVTLKPELYRDLLAIQRRAPPTEQQRTPANAPAKQPVKA